MNAIKFAKLLYDLGACSDGKEFAKGKTLATVWRTLKRADWMCWLLVKMADKPGWPNKSIVRLALCDCAETALPIWHKYYPDDTRPDKAIEMARRYAKGKATDELAAAWAAAGAAAGAAGAAWAARAAAWAARAAAWAAAWAAAGAAGAAWAAWAAAEAAGAAWAAAEAAAGAAGAAWAAAEAAGEAAHLKMCLLVRKRIGKFKALED